MAGHVIDIHPHIIASDTARYPQKPLFGIQSDWSRDRPVSAEQMIAAMDAAGIAKSALVHASTCYGYDNSYVTDSIARFPGRFTGVGSIDMLASDALARAEGLIGQGINGFRIFTGGSTKEVDASSLDDARSFPVWELLSARGLSMCVQTNPAGLAATANMARRFPKVRIILDHMGRPDLKDGPPYTAAKTLFALAALPNIYLKHSAHVLHGVKEGKASAETFFAKVIAEFGAQRIAWGSNYPTSKGTLSEHLALGRASLATVGEADREWIFRKTALELYPALRD